MADKLLNGSLEDGITYGRSLGTLAHLSPILADVSLKSDIMQEVRRCAENILAAAQADPSIAKKLYQISLEKRPTLQNIVQDTLDLGEKSKQMRNSTHVTSPIHSTVLTPGKRENEESMK